MKGRPGTKLYEWQLNPNGTCVKCGYEGRMTVDHIIPVTIIEVIDRTGRAVVNDEDNFQYLYGACNAMKSNRIDIQNPKTKELLLKYVNAI